MHGSVVAGHGSRDGSLQAEAQGHPGALPTRDQPHVRLVIRPLRQTLLLDMYKCTIRLSVYKI